MAQEIDNVKGYAVRHETDDGTIEHISMSNNPDWAVEGALEDARMIADLTGQKADIVDMDTGESVGGGTPSQGRSSRGWPTRMSQSQFDEIFRGKSDDLTA